MKRTNARTAALAFLALVAAACGGDGGPAEETGASDDDLVASVASYELEAGSPQRFLVGLTTQQQELVGYGTAALTFTYTGTADDPLPEGRDEQQATATYRLIPGQRPTGDPDVSRTVGFEEGAGVYAADGVTFAEPGFWDVEVRVSLDGQPRRAEGTFEVLEDSTVVEVGDPAPRTVNHLPGAEGVPPGAVDSRAEGAAVPDRALHAETVADVLASGRPLVVVASTPVYCVSRFCGPITDSVDALARQYGDRVGFVHLEVWRDYEGQVLNKAAAEWILPDAGPAEGREPWVFVVDDGGTVKLRFDNVVSDAELEAAVQGVLP